MESLKAFDYYVEFVLREVVKEENEEGEKQTYTPNRKKKLKED